MYVKLFGTILDSSIWATDLPTRVVWITMLAMADEYGVVYASVGGLSRRACVSERACAKALKELTSPDPDSRTKDHEGRRIEPLEGGWKLLNYGKYRELRTRKQMADAIRQTRHRNSKRDTSQSSVIGHDVTTEAEAEREAEAEAEQKSKALVAHATPEHPNVTDVRAQTQQRATREAALRLGVQVVFGYWAAVMGKTGCVLDSKREARLLTRLRENGANISELLYAVDGARRDEFLMGRDPKAGRKYDGIETIFRDRAQVERLYGLAPNRNGDHPFLQQPNA